MQWAKTSENFAEEKMFAEDISEDFSDLTFTGFYSISGYLRNRRGRLLSSEKFSEVFTPWVFTLKPFPDQPPYRRYGPDTEIQYRPRKPHGLWQNPAEFSPKDKPIRNFSIDPTSSMRTLIADAIFADAISETRTFRGAKGPSQPDLPLRPRPPSEPSSRT